MEMEDWKDVLVLKTTSRRTTHRVEAMEAEGQGQEKAEEAEEAMEAEVTQVAEPPMLKKARLRLMKLEIREKTAVIATDVDQTIIGTSIAKLARDLLINTKHTARSLS